MKTIKNKEVILELEILKFRLSDDLSNPNPDVVEDAIKLIEDRDNVKNKLIDIANNMANVRDWMEIPEETFAGINGNIDEINRLIDKL